MFLKIKKSGVAGGFALQYAINLSELLINISIQRREEKKMVKIRLKRMGAKKKPFYRIVVADSRNQRDGKTIAEIGYYDPMKEPAEIKIDNDAARKWLSTGAQPTDTVRSLFKKAGTFSQPDA